MNRTLPETGDGGHSSRSGSGSGRPGSQQRQQQQNSHQRLNRTVSSGYAAGQPTAAVRVGVGSPPIYAERDPRLRALADPDTEFGLDGDFGNFHDYSESPPSALSSSSRLHQQGQRQRLRDNMHSEYSIDNGSSSADGDLTASGSSPQTAPVGTSTGGSTMNPFKSIWKKTVNKLIKKMKTDNSASTPAAAAAAAPTTGSAADAAQLGRGPDGQVDPVYSFLKLTSVMPRQGTTNVLPGEGHRCCPGSKSNGEMNEVDIDDTTYTHSNDPSRCECPCHLPERLDAYRYEWRRAFVIKKT